MSIVKKLVDVMNGSIEVETELGKGTKFTLVLQHKVADNNLFLTKTDMSLVDEQQILQGKHVLLAEDNDLNAEIAITILEDMGLIVERVEDGIQCVAKMEQMPAKSYDLILMDVQMPHMDGYKATETIRELSDEGKAHIPIVALTANAFEEDRKMAISKGMRSEEPSLSVWCRKHSPASRPQRSGNSGHALPPQSREFPIWKITYSSLF